MLHLRFLCSLERSRIELWEKTLAFIWSAGHLVHARHRKNTYSVPELSTVTVLYSRAFCVLTSAYCYQLLQGMPESAKSTVTIWVTMNGS